MTECLACLISSAVVSSKAGNPARLCCEQGNSGKWTVSFDDLRNKEF